MLGLPENFLKERSEKQLKPKILKAGINVFTAFTLIQITGGRVNETLLTCKPGKLEF